MKDQKKRGIRAVFAVLVIVSILYLITTSYFAAGYKLKGEIEGIHLVRPDSKYIDKSYVPSEYLSVEDLLFYTCIEEPNIAINSSVICLDDNSFEDIALQRWTNNENCYIGSYDLEKKSCGNLLIQSYYTKNDEVVKLSKRIKVNRFTSLLDLTLDTQYSDGGWKNELDTASGIWILSHYKDLFPDEIEKGLSWLKEYRDNSNKCWPKDDCSITTTAKIMAMLEMSGYNDSYRIIHDGRLYLKKKQNYFSSDDVWRLNVKPYFPLDTQCIITYNRSHLNREPFNISANEVRSYNITPYPNERIIVICDKNIKANLTTNRNELVFSYEGDNMSYYMPYACWSKDNKWGNCDILTTEFALISNFSNESNRTESAFDYLRTEVNSEPTGEKYVGNGTNVTETALYLYHINDSSIVEWMRYKQNNNGSWGSGDDTEKLEETTYAILGLTKYGYTRNNEVIHDAEHWVTSQELNFAENLTADYVGWNSTYFDALAFTVLQHNIRPILKSRPKIVICNKEITNVEIYNPTIFNLSSLKYELSDNLKDIVEIVDGEEKLSAYSYFNLKIKRLKQEQGNVYGYLSIYNGDDETGKIPIIVYNFPDIKINVKKENIMVFGTKARIEFSVKKTQHKFNCNVSWDEDDISTKKNIVVNDNSIFLDATFNNAERVEKTYTGSFDCTANDKEFNIPFSINIDRYPSFPFSVDVASIKINSTNENKNFIIKNNLDESIEVNVKLVKGSPYINLDQKSFIIDPSEEANVSIINTIPDKKNYSYNDAIEITALGQKKTIRVSAHVVYTEKGINPVVLLSMMVLVIVFLSAAGFLAYKKWDNILALFNKGEDKRLIKIKKIEEKEKKTAILNMMRILRMLNTEEEEIRKRLIEEGFSEKEIDEAISMEENPEGEEDVDQGLFNE